jgi:hypothetical protein
MTLYRMLQRRGTASQWSTANTVLGVGEIGFAIDTNVTKVGDGVTAWNSLPSISAQALPSQTSNSGKFLTTNGTAASWSTIDLSSKQDKVADVSDTEIGYLDGVTSAIQTQINAKQDKVTDVSDAEIGYLNGVTSAIQTQINTKAPIASPTFTGTVSGLPAAPTTDNSAKAIGYIGLPQVQVSSSKTFSESDAGKHQWVGSGGLTLTIPANSSVPFEIGTTLIVINSGVTSSIAITDDTLRLAGSSSVGTRSLATYGVATIVKVQETTWVASGNGLT